MKEEGSSLLLTKLSTATLAASGTHFIWRIQDFNISNLRQTLTEHSITHSFCDTTAFALETLNNTHRISSQLSAISHAMTEVQPQ